MEQKQEIKQKDNYDLSEQILKVTIEEEYVRGIINNYMVPIIISKNKKLIKKKIFSFHKCK